MPAIASSKCAWASAVPDAPLVLADERDHVLTLTLNRGERYTPLSRAMVAALAPATPKPA